MVLPDRIVVAGKNNTTTLIASDRVSIKNKKVKSMIGVGGENAVCLFSHEGKKQHVGMQLNPTPQVVINNAGKVKRIQGGIEEEKPEPRSVENTEVVKEPPPKSEFEKMMKRATHHVHATRLFQDYEDNEFAADEKYKGKIVLVRGNITHLSETFGTPTVQLEAGLLTNIVCSMQKSQKPLLAQLKKGQDVLIVGKVTGKSLGIGMEDCLVGLPAK